MFKQHHYKVIIASLGILVALSGCAKQEQNDEKQVDTRPVLTVTHFVTPEGLECVSIKPRFNSDPEGISCNWADWVWRRNNGKL
jgi:hypothetical protein